MGVFIFALIGLYALGSVLWGSNFSERHVLIPGLEVPIFMGEILSVVCLFLFAFKFERQNLRLTVWDKCFVAYWIFIFFYALWEYGGTRPLALRNAALFYYPGFAFLAYHLFKREYFNQAVVYVLLGVCMVLSTRAFDTSYFAYTLFVLAVVLLMRARHRHLRIVLGIVLAVSANYGGWFVGSRTNLIGTLGALVFLAAVFIIFLLNFDRKVKLAMAGVFMVAVSAGVFHFADRNGLQSMVKMNHLFEQYQSIQERIDQHKKNYRAEPFPVAVYHDNKNKIEHVPSQARLLNEAGVRSSGTAGYRPLNDAQNNAIFRLLVWHDMIEELKDKRAWWGVGLSLPQRSPSLEIIWWGTGEWSRDGWVAPHNSFLHIIYRLGLLGLLMILAIGAAMLTMTRRFILLKSKEGILLVSILVYWLTACHTLVILELPHYAIVFWTLFGMTWAYGNRQLANKVPA